VLIDEAVGTFGAPRRETVYMIYRVINAAMLVWTRIDEFSIVMNAIDF
jgi:hypothetical protein